MLNFNSLDRLVTSLFGGTESLAARWWNSPNKAFDAKTPLEVYETDPEKIQTYLLKHIQY